VIDERSDSSHRDQFTATFVELAIRLAALGALLYFAFVLIRPFISIVIWSVVLTVALYPAFEWLARRLQGRRRLAAFLITLFSLLIVIGPATWLALDLTESIQQISGQFDLSAVSLPPPPQSVKGWPLIGDPVYQFWYLASTNLSAALSQLAPQLKPLGGSLLRIAASMGTGILKFFAAVILAGFLFVPAPALADAVRNFLRRLVSKRGEEFISLAGTTIRTVSRGVIGISVVQALFAAIGLTIAGVPGAGLITSAVLISGIIQIGPSVILIPVVIWSWTAMDAMTALIFSIYMIAVNLMDNVLRPMVMGRGLKTPLLVTLVGVIGGTLAYGITGLFLGPIVLAVSWELLTAWTNDQTV
jgi:predicted PurR-regulated permease PerM